MTALQDYYTKYQIQSGQFIWNTQTHLSWHWEKAGGRCPCKQRDTTRMLIIKSIERIENLSSSVFQPKIGMRSWWFKSFSVRLGKNNCSNPSHLPAHQAGSVERREAYVRLHLSITAYSHTLLDTKPFYRDDISYMYPKLTPVHPKRILLADLERINIDKKDILDQRKQYLWIRSIHAF